MLVKRRKDELAELTKSVNDLFEGFFKRWDWPLVGQRAWPVVDVLDEDDAVVVRAEVPGCKPEDIDISIRGDVLTITGEKKQTKEVQEKGYYHAESAYGSFRRDIYLPTEVEADKVDATCKDGVLTIRLPKAQEARAVKIKVKG